MKKIMALLLVVVMVFALCACATSSQSASNKKVKYFDEYSKLPTPDSLFEVIKYDGEQQGTKVYEIEKESVDGAYSIFLNYLGKCEDYGFEYEEVESKIYWIKYKSEKVCLVGFNNTFGVYNMVILFQ